MSKVSTILGTNSVNDSKDVFVCEDRYSPGDKPRDITAIRNHYLPLDSVFQSDFRRKNLFGVVIYRQKVQAGGVYSSYDGKRLVLEVGCKTVIYVLINRSLSLQHHRIFIQSDDGFSFDTTIRNDAKKIVHNTRHIETIVKYEMYFLMGVLSTVSFSTWLMVTGADLTVIYAQNRSKAEAAKNLTKALLLELIELEKYAPTLYHKIVSLIEAEAVNNASHTAKKIPKEVLQDEKFQAQVSGILFGKWINSSTSKPFTIWTVFSVFLVQAAVKSGIKSAEVYQATLNQRYMPIIADIKNINPSNPNSFQIPAQKITNIMKEAGVKISLEEVNTILKEVASNPQKAFKNMNNVVKAIETFNAAMEN